MNKLLFLLPALLLAPLCRADNAQAVHNAPFVVNGNQTMQLPVTDAGPAPARVGDVMMKMAGPLFGASKVRKGESDMVWAFAVACPENSVYSRLTIENISGSSPLAVLAEDDPKVKPVHAADGFNGFLIRVVSSPIVVSPQTVPWLYQDANSAIVFRVTLTTAKGESLVMYQPTSLDAATKKKIRDMVQQVTDSAKAAPAAATAP